MRGAAGLLAAMLLGVAGAPARLSVDLDGSGRTATVLLFQHAGAVGVVVRFADRRHPAQRFHFVVDPAREDAVCRLPVRIALESLAVDRAQAASLGANLGVPARGQGFQVSDGSCDAIHFYWNARDGRVVWWRL